MSQDPSLGSFVRYALPNLHIAVQAVCDTGEAINDPFGTAADIAPQEA